MLIRSGLGLSFGVIFSVLLFKRRAWPAWVGLGFGAGRAWEESDGISTISARAPCLILLQHHSDEGTSPGVRMDLGRCGHRKVAGMVLQHAYKRRHLYHYMYSFWLCEEDGGLDSHENRIGFTQSGLIPRQQCPRK